VVAEWPNVVAEENSHRRCAQGEPNGVKLEVQVIDRGFAGNFWVPARRRRLAEGGFQLQQRVPVARRCVRYEFHLCGIDDLNAATAVLLDILNENSVPIANNAGQSDRVDDPAGDSISLDMAHDPFRVANPNPGSSDQ
jgi:hypothetical protein